METTYVHKTALGALLDSSEIGTIGLVIFVYTVVGMLNHSPPFCLPPSLPPSLLNSPPSSLITECE